jgi:multicomponent Na+:H+ antiporter subunit A
MKQTISRIAFFAPLLMFSAFLALVPGVSSGRIFRFAIDWIPDMAVRLSFTIDGLGLLFALIITGIGVFVFLYAASYMGSHLQIGRFYGYLTLFMIAMLGVVLSDNLITLFVFWELTTVTSYLLIGFNHENQDARDNARQGLLVTATGGLSLLAGFLLMGIVSGSMELSEIVIRSDTVRQHDMYLPILLLILAGAFTKSAQYPFHFWLPNAMSAPTPISAYLHSATMVKAGIYLLVRLQPILGGTDVWIATLTVTGAVTALWGSFSSLGQDDLKKILAYTTLMALGMLTMFLASDTEEALVAALTFLVVHSLYKSALFLIAGIIDHQCATRDLDSLGGLARTMPFTAFACFAAALSMAGFPLFFGFVGKEIMYKGALVHEAPVWLAAGTALFANSLMTTVSGLLAVKPFLGKPADTPKPPHEAPFSMWIGPCVLGGLGIAFGIVPWVVSRYLVTPAFSTIHGPSGPVHLALFHGINTPLVLSAATLAIGISLYHLMKFLRPGLKTLTLCFPLNASAGYDRFMTGIARFAQYITEIIQSGSLNRYLLTITTVYLLAVGGTLVLKNAWILPDRPVPVFYQEWLLAAMVAAGSAVPVFTRSRLTAVCALGAAGAGVALLFLVFGAPDVALTQLLVETLTVIIVSIVMLRLPSLRCDACLPRRTKARDGLLSLGIGATVTMLLWGATEGDIDRFISTFYESNSYIAAHGRNIVNVILVDFRGLDTMGEITVVAIAAFAGYGLIKLSRKTG